jgi:DNA-binding NarL/FixJ family response regulator
MTPVRGHQSNPETGVVVVDDEESVRISLKFIIDRCAGFRCVNSYATARDLIAALPAPGVEIILLDLQMPGMHGVDCLMFLKTKQPDLQVVIVSASEEPSMIQRCADLGCAGYVTKPFSRTQILASLLHAAATRQTTLAKGIPNACRRDWVEPGDCPTFTAIEHRILRLIANGLPYKQVAVSLKLSESTVRNALHKLIHRLGAVNGVTAVQTWQQCRRCAVRVPVD